MTTVKARASLSDLTRRRSIFFFGEELFEMNTDKKGKGVFLCSHEKGPLPLLIFIEEKEIRT